MENGVTTTGEADSLDFCFGPIQLVHLLLIFFLFCPFQLFVLRIAAGGLGFQSCYLIPHFCLLFCLILLRFRSCPFSSDGPFSDSPAFRYFVLDIPSYFLSMFY